MEISKLLEGGRKFKNEASRPQIQYFQNVYRYIRN